METKTCNCAQNSIDNGKIEAIVAAHEGKQASLIPVLQAIQEEYGYLPEAAMDIVSRGVGVTVSQIFGVATFYKQFRLTPQGKYMIKVCHGTACHVAGAEGISVALRGELGIEDGGTTPDLKFTLEPVACLGCCSLAPVVMVGEETHGRLTPDKAKKVVAKYGISQ
jgi:NADH:ubiquinone oxidoreductase subunit E